MEFKEVHLFVILFAFLFGGFFVAKVSSLMIVLSDPGIETKRGRCI